MPPAPPSARARAEQTVGWLGLALAIVALAQLAYLIATRSSRIDYVLTCVLLLAMGGGQVILVLVSRPR